MAITRAQQAKQMLQEGGMTKKIKGQEHMLAYITPGEADKLVELGGQETMTPEGIPAYPPQDWKSSKPSKTTTNTPPSGGANNYNYRGPADLGVTTRKKDTVKAPEPYVMKGGKKHFKTGFDEDGKSSNVYDTEIKKSQEIVKANQEKTFKNKYVTPTQKFLYGLVGNNPKNEKAYVRYLQSQGVTIPPDLLKAIEEEDKKLSFEDFQNLVAFNPPDYRVDPIMAQNLGINPDYAPMNFAEYMASKGNFNLITGGNVGNLKDFKNPGGIIDPKTGLPMTDFEFEKLKQRSSQYEPGGGGDPTRPDPCKGPNPPAYCFVDPPSDPTDPSTPSTGVFAGIAPRFAGSIFDFDALRAGAMDGGIMNNKVMGGMADGNIDEAGRQMYFLGKLVKKATRAVKKVAKSPFGKAALGAALFKFGGGFGGGSGTGILSKLKTGLIGTLSGGEENIFKGGKFSGLANFLRDQYTSDGGKLKFGLGLGLGVPFALDMLGVGKDDDDKMDLDEYYRTQGINVADIRLNPYKYLSAANQGSLYAADGGLMRMGYQEGGDAEPVAKKTMPLIDMDGQEKDYRETGGFVDMGRMERADDVPARLSKNEFVFTADAVRNAGEGDIDKGAEVMYNMMKNLEAGGEVSEESQGLEGAREMFKTSQRLGEVL